MALSLDQLSQSCIGHCQDFSVEDILQPQVHARVANNCAIGRVQAAGHIAHSALEPLGTRVSDSLASCTAMHMPAPCMTLRLCPTGAACGGCCEAGCRGGGGAWPQRACAHVLQGLPARAGMHAAAQGLLLAAAEACQEGRQGMPGPQTQCSTAIACRWNFYCTLCNCLGACMLAVVSRSGGCSAS